MNALTLCALFGSLFVATTAQSCGGSDYTAVIGCVQGKIAKELSELESQKQAKITEDRKTITDCYKQNSCTAAIKFDDFTSYLPDQKLKDVANLVVELWGDAPKEMQLCILTDVRDLLVEAVTTCMTSKVPGFSLSKPLPPIPLPSSDAYKNNKDLLKQYVTDKLVAGLALKDCPKDKRVATAKCMTLKGEKAVKSCIKDKFCSKPACKAGFTSTCTAFVDCVTTLVKDGKTKLSSLQDSSSSKILAFLDKCEGEAQKVNPDYKYSHVKVLKLAKLVGGIKAENLEPELKETVKSLAHAYFSVESLCYNQCE